MLERRGWGGGDEGNRHERGRKGRRGKRRREEERGGKVRSQKGEKWGVSDERSRVGLSLCMHQASQEAASGLRKLEDVGDAI